MQSEIALRTKTATASNLLHLAPVVRRHNHARPDGCTVGGGSNQLYQQPGVRRGQLIAQQRRIIIQIVDCDAGASGIEDISKSRAAAASRFKKSWARLIRNVGKAMTVKIAHQNELALSLRKQVVRARARRIDGTTDNQDVGLTVIIEVHKAGAPFH